MGPFFPNERYASKGNPAMRATAPKKGKAAINGCELLFKMLPTEKVAIMSVGIIAIKVSPMTKILRRDAEVMFCIHLGASVILFLFFIDLIIK